MAVSVLCLFLAVPELDCDCGLFLIILIGVATITQYTHVRNKKSNTRGSSPNVVKVIFHTLRNSVLLKERMRSLCEQILSFKRSSYFEKGHNLRNING